MANKNQVVEAQGVEATNENTDLALAGQFNPYQDLTDRIAMMKEKPDSELLQLTGAEFLKIEKGDVLHLVACGFTETPNPTTGNPQKTAVFYDEAGKQWYGTHGIIISTLSKFAEDQLAAGINIRIVVKDKVKGKNGLTYQDMDIYRI